MKIKNKRYRIHWGRISVLVIIIAAIVTALTIGIKGIIGLFDGTDKTSQTTDSHVEAIDPQALKTSQEMSQRIEDFMQEPMRLDTSKIAISIYDLTSRQQVFSRHDQQLLPVASCMKIPTAIAALKILGMNHRYHTTLQVRGTMHGDTLVGNLLLHADDDPLLTTFNDLTDHVRRIGIHAIRGNIYMLLAREDTLRPHPSAKTWDIFYNRTPLLLKGKNFIRRDLMASLRGSGISYIRDTSVQPEGKYRVVAHQSHGLQEVITPMIIHSSNIKAESVFYHLDYKQRLISDHRQQWTPPHAVEQWLRSTFCTDSIMVIDGNTVGSSTHTMAGFVLNDGSGLSPDNRLTASFLVDIMRYAYADKPLHDYLINEALATPDDGLRRGSLLSRMQQPECRGRIFCKTGTMTTIGCSSLTGYIHAADNHWYAFAIINTDSPVAESRIFQDKLCKLIIKN